jgi:hypothetical protein
MLQNFGIVCALFVSASAVADHHQTATGSPHGQPAQQGSQKTANPAEAAGWAPRPVTKEDKKGVTAMLDAVDAAWMKRDLNAAAALVDFPVMMVTDDSKGVVTSGWWTKEKWVETMTQAMQSMPKDAPRPQVKHQTWFVSDSIAHVHSEHTMKTGGKSLTVRSSSLAVLKDGKWMMKSMVDPGWGGTMKPSANAQQGMR